MSTRLLSADCLVTHVETNCLGATYDSWHLLTKSRGGTISLIKNLTKHECEFAKARALGLPATEAEKDAETKRNAELTKKCLEHADSNIPCGDNSWTMTMIKPGDIEAAECFE